MSLVSVIIPVYNSENTITDCIKSILNQSWIDWEVIIVNDGSTDQTEEVINIIIKGDSRFKLINQDNSGSPIAKNVALSLAKGDYIQFLDADDYLNNDKFENQVNYLQSNVNDLIWCSTIKFNDDKKNNIDKVILHEITSPIDFLLCLNGIDGQIGMIQPNAFMISRDLIKKAGNWNILLNDSPDDDSEFFSRIILCSNKIFYDNRSINYYREPSLHSVSKKIKKESILGAIKSVELKFTNIIKVKKNATIIDLYVFHLSNLAYVYGRYHVEAVIQTENLIKTFGQKKFKQVGGKRFLLLSAIIGFKNSIYLIRVFNKVFK